MTAPLDRFPAFVAELRGRLEAGARAYGDRSFDRAPAELLGELEQEALDLAGWGFVLFERIRRARAAAEGTRALPPDACAAGAPLVSVARMVIAPTTGRDAVCVPLVALEGAQPKTWQPLDPIALSRVPTQGECIRSADGRTLHVIGVLHHVAGEVAAELHCADLSAPALPAASEAGQIDLGSDAP